MKSFAINDYKSERIRTLSGAVVYWKTRIMANCKPKIMAKCFSLLWNTPGKSKPPSAFYLFCIHVSNRLIGRCLYVIKFDITDKCNLKCKMCYMQYKLQHNEQQMDMRRLKLIIEQIGKVSLRLEFLGGEPLLCDNLCELIRFAKSKTAVKDIVLYTNGTLATEKVALELKDAGLDKAIVTLISHNPKKHDSFTGLQGSWIKTIAGITNLKKAGIRTYTFTALHSENYSDLSIIYEFVRNQLKVSPLFYHYVPQSKNDYLGLSALICKELKRDILQKYSKKHCDFMERVIRSAGRLCLGGHYMVSIKSDGTVTPCPFIHDICLGNVEKDSIWDIFAQASKNKEFLCFRLLPQECSNCSYKDVCGGGCRAGNIFLGGSYVTRDYHCLGPWSEPIRKEIMHDRLPNFF